MDLGVSLDFHDVTLGSDAAPTPSNVVYQLTSNRTLLDMVRGGGGAADGSCETDVTDAYQGFYATAQFVTGLVIYPILCITGLAGNALSLLVLSHRDMASSTNIYLFALCISDSLKLLNDFLYSVMLVISQHNPAAAETMMVNVYPYAHYVLMVSVSVTAWITVSVAMDRYICVCHPSRSRALCTIPKARMVVAVVYIIMILISIPLGFRYRLKTIDDLKNNLTCMVLEVTELGRNPEFMIPYTWLHNFLRGIIPVFILMFINARIINVLRKERVKGKKFSSRNRITVMLVAMVVIFIICITPDAVMSTFFGKGYVEEDYLVKGIREITDSLVALNSALNFILYCSLSAVFRKTFMRIFFGRRYTSMHAGSGRNVSRDGTSVRGVKKTRSLKMDEKNGGGRDCDRRDSTDSERLTIAQTQFNADSIDNIGDKRKEKRNSTSNKNSSSSYDSKEIGNGLNSQNNRQRDDEDPNPYAVYIGPVNEIRAAELVVSASRRDSVTALKAGIPKPSVNHENESDPNGDVSESNARLYVFHEGESEGVAL